MDSSIIINGIYERIYGLLQISTMCKTEDSKKCHYRTEWKMGFKFLGQILKLKN